MDILGGHYSDCHTNKQLISNFHSLKPLDVGGRDAIIKLILIRVNLPIFPEQDACISHIHDFIYSST